MSQLALVLGDAFRLAVAFNPVTSLVGSIVAAALMARSGSRVRMIAGAGVLLAAWVVGDGMLSLWVAGSGGSESPDVAGAAWVLGSLGALLLGYVAPTWAGVFVGRRVTWGTGWLSAAVVAGSASGAITAIAGRLG